MTEGRPPVTERSYGVVLVRPARSGTSLKSQDAQVLLVHQHLRPGPRLPASQLDTSPSLPSTFIALPKGHRDPSDESDLAAALRELREETGLGVARVLCDGSMITERYTNPRNGREKENTFWVALVEGDGEGVKVQEEEVEWAEWVGFEEALKMATYEETRGVLRQAAVMLDKA